MTTTQLTAPALWAPYLINGDDSGLHPHYAAEARAWVESVGLGTPVSAEDAGFRWSHDAIQFMPHGADCQLYTFMGAA